MTCEDIEDAFFPNQEIDPNVTIPTPFENLLDCCAKDKSYKKLEKSIKQKQKIIHYEFLLIQIESSGTHFLFIKMLLSLLSLSLIINILFHRDYTMVEEIRKSDHRPVYCQFILHKNEKKRLLQTNPNLVLRLTNLAITSETNEKVLYSKVCSPILSDDMNWEQRYVFSRFHFNYK